MRLLVLIYFPILALAQGRIDLTTGAAPASPSTGKIRIYGNSTTGKLTCKNSTGGDCMPFPYLVEADGKIVLGVSGAWAVSPFTLALPGAVGAVLYSDGTNWTRETAPTISAANMTFPAKLLVRTCEIAIGDPGAASPALANDNDTPAVCGNLTGATMTITEVKCYADSSTGSPAVLPIITGGAADSILSSAIACGNAAFGSAGTLNGTPTQADGASIDANISTAGGTAKYIVIRIKRSL